LRGHDEAIENQKFFAQMALHDKMSEGLRLAHPLAFAQKFFIGKGLEAQQVGWFCQNGAVRLGA